MSNNTEALIAEMKAAAEKKPRYAKEISITFINKYLIYDGTDFYWKERGREEFNSDGKHKAWNRRFSGVKAGCVSPQGYVDIEIKKSKFKAHRIVWCLHNGSIPPDMQVDHINHIRTDNRIENLRLVTQTENQRNSSLRADNKAGKSGVKWHKTQRKWHAFIRDNGKQRHLGCFKDFDSAVAARKAAEKELGYHEHHGKRVCSHPEAL